MGREGERESEMMKKNVVYPQTFRLARDESGEQKASRIYFHDDGELFSLA
jgi:hypothetical protein